MARGTGTWVVLRNGERVVEKCKLLPVMLNLPVPIHELLVQEANKAGLSSINNLIRAITLDYLEARYKKEHTK